MRKQRLKQRLKAIAEQRLTMFEHLVEERRGAWDTELAKIKFGDAAQKTQQLRFQTQKFDPQRYLVGFECSDKHAHAKRMQRLRRLVVEIDRRLRFQQTRQEPVEFQK